MDNHNKIILDLCGGTGCWSLPYLKAGYDVRVITLPYYDVCTYEPPTSCVYGVLAAPPCTDFSIAGAQYWSKKDYNGSTARSLNIVYNCLRIIEQCKPKFWALENPVGRLRKFIGDPVASFCWSDFGFSYRKRTLFWGNFNSDLIKSPYNGALKLFASLKVSELPQLPTGYNLNIDHNKIAAQRSVYPPDFCNAFYLANQ